MNFRNLLILILFLGISANLRADCFTSSETKELITKADRDDKDAQLQVGYAYDSGNGAQVAVIKQKILSHGRRAAETLKLKIV